MNKDRICKNCEHRFVTIAGWSFCVIHPTKIFRMYGEACGDYRESKRTFY